MYNDLRMPTTFITIRTVWVAHAMTYPLEDRIVENKSQHRSARHFRICPVYNDKQPGLMYTLSLLKTPKKSTWYHYDQRNERLDIIFLIPQYLCFTPSSNRLTATVELGKPSIRACPRTFSIRCPIGKEGCANLFTIRTRSSSS